MSIRKQYLKTKPICRVTFRLPKDQFSGAKSVYVVGEFNNWDDSATPMKNLKKGGFAATMDLDVNREYQFRYLIDESYWENDACADKYVHSAYGNCDNSVIVV